MKKLVLSLLVAFVLLAIAWVGITWFIGQQTEAQIQNSLKQKNELLAQSGFSQKLVKYDKGFLESEAVIKLIATTPPFDRLIGDMNFLVKINNGPVLLTETGMSIGASHWHVTIDQKSLSPEAKAFVKKAFGGKEPLVTDMIVGFGNDITYEATLNAMQMSEKNENVSIATTMITGTSNLKTLVGDAQVKVGKIKANSKDATFNIPAINIDVDITGYVAQQMLGTMKLVAPNISIIPTKGSEQQKVMFDFNMNTDSKEKAGNLIGTIAFDAKNIQEPTKSVKNIQYSMTLEGFKLKGIQELNQLQAEISHIQSQMGWNMKETQTPEGQEKMMQLLNKMQEIPAKMLAIAQQNLLQSGKSRIIQSLKIDNDKGKANADAIITYIGAKKPLTLKSLPTTPPDQLAALINATLKIQVDKAMLPEPIKSQIAPMVQQKIVTETDKQYLLDSNLNTGKITLNGETMPFLEFVQRYSPRPRPAQSGNDIPADIQKRIQNEGFTPEVMNLIDESDDISPETKEMIKQLQQIQNSAETKVEAVEKDKKDKIDDASETKVDTTEKPTTSQP